MSKTIKWVLALSLFLNVLLAGVLLGHVSGDMAHPPRMHDMPKNIAGLSPEKQKMVDEVWADFRSGNSERFTKMKAAREEVVAIMEAPEFDEAAFRAKSAELGAMMSESKKKMIDNMANVAKQFNQEERKALAQHMRRPPTLMGPPDRK